MANVMRQIGALERSMVLLPSAARTAAPDTQEIRGYTAPGVVVVVNVTNVGEEPAAPEITVTVQGVDPYTGATWTLLASAAIAGVGAQTLTIFPGVGNSANVSASLALPPAFRVSVAHDNADPITYQVTAHLLG